MDAQLGTEAKAAAALRVLRQHLGIGCGGGHAIHRSGQTGAARGHHHSQPNGGKFCFVGSAAHAEIGLQVDVPQTQTQHTLCAGQGVHLPHAFSAFDQGQHRHAADQKGALNLLRCFSLGQHDRTQAGQVAQHRQVGLVPRCGCGIDAHQEAGALGFVKTRPGRCQRSACFVFGIQRHGIFQVDDHRIRTTGQGLGKALGAVARHKQETARLRERQHGHVKQGPRARQPWARLRLAKARPRLCAWPRVWPLR